jgi:two-component system sensor histidine kinase VicK
MIEEIACNNIQLIQSILKREQLVANNVGIKKERLDMVWEVKHAMAMYLEAQKSLQKDINFTYSQEKIYAEVDSLKFIQVVNNLVSNALKFTGPKGAIQVHLKRLESTFLLTVQDDGIGIPEKLQPFLFQKYSKAGRIGLDGQDSVGLGMWIVKSIVDEHQGKVWFESEEGTGSTFYVELPIGEHT